MAQPKFLLRNWTLQTTTRCGNLALSARVWPDNLNKEFPRFYGMGDAFIAPPHHVLEIFQLEDSWLIVSWL